MPIPVSSLEIASILTADQKRVTFRGLSDDGLSKSSKSLPPPPPYLSLLLTSQASGFLILHTLVFRCTQCWGRRGLRLSLGLRALLLEH